MSKLGLNTSDYDFIRLPIFGWYARSKSSNFVGNIFDFFPPANWAKLYSTLHRDFSDCFDFKVPYSEYAEKKLFENQRRIMEFQSAWVMAKDEASSVRVRDGQDVVYFRDHLKVLGMPALLYNEVGYVTERVINTFPKLNMEKKHK